MPNFKGDILKSSNPQILKLNLHYHRFGSGPRILLAIHGFADRGELFFKLRDVLEENFTVIAVDLPFHGLTSWEAHEFNPEQLRDDFLDIFEKEGIDGSFSIMGHSMGGRVVLAMSDFFEDRIDSYIMLAPAGFQGTQSDSRIFFPKFIRRLLKGLTAWPAFIISIFKGGKFLGIINKGTYRFLEQQIAIPERRHRLFDCWISLYDFPIRLKAFKERVIRTKAKLCFFYGTKDFITPAKYGRHFIADMPNAKIFLVEDGHYFLKEPLVEALKEAKEFY